MVIIKKPSTNTQKCNLQHLLLILFLSVLSLLIFSISLFRHDSVKNIAKKDELKQEKKFHKLSNFKGESITLNSSQMPAIGFGTCCRRSAKGIEIYKSTLLFLKNGGRLIDTAMAYNNHKEIGKAIKESGLNRNEIWITSKIAVNKVYGIEGTLRAINSIIEELDVGDYLDLCLIHSPKRGKTATIDMWRGLIRAQQNGKIYSIGVSNFNQHEIMDLYTATQIMPELNQIQFHPWTFPEWKALVMWQTSVGIGTTAYTSLGGSRFHSHHDTSWPPILTDLAKKYKVTEPQVLLRWALRQNIAVIPGATSELHIIDNIHVPTFDLTDKECEQLEMTDAPEAWWDIKRGPVKYSFGDAHISWNGDHTTHK